MTAAPKSFAAIVIYDDPDCSGAAGAFSDLARRLPSLPPPEQINTEVFLVPASATRATSSSTALESNTTSNNINNNNNNNFYGDALLESLRGLVNYRPNEIVVIGLLKDASSASSACQKIREICNETRPAITECHLATHLANYSDVGLVVRNLVRRFHDAASRAVNK